VTLDVKWEEILASEELVLGLMMSCKMLNVQLFPEEIVAGITALLQWFLRGRFRESCKVWVDSALLSFSGCWMSVCWSEGIPRKKGQ
jgi:hypothetical protein